MNIANELTKMAKQVMAEDTPTEKQIGEARSLLAARLRPILGFQPTFQVSKGPRGHLYFEDDIGSAMMGVFSAVFRGASVKAVVNTTPMSDGSYYASVDLNWESHRGGTNGSEVARAWFQPDKGDWVIEAYR